MNDRRGHGPGLSKANGNALGRARSGELIVTTDVRWRELLDAADVLTEGSMRTEHDGSSWYGSTSLVLTLPPEAGDRERLLRLACGDPHLRLRVMRIAQREAAARAPAELGSVICEVRTVADPRGLRIDVDVQAPLIGVRASGTEPGGRTPGP